MQVKKATLADIKDISKVMKVLDFSEYNYSNEEEIRKAVDTNEYFIAVDEDRTVGAMILILEENSYQIRAMASSKKGTGRLLVNFAIDKCKKEGVPKLWCWSLARRKVVAGRGLLDLR